MYIQGVPASSCFLPYFPVYDRVPLATVIFVAILRKRGMM